MFGKILVILLGLSFISIVAFPVSVSFNMDIEKTNECLSFQKIDTTVSSFFDDPVVNITSPEPGLYLFGNKIFPMDRIILIGSFTVEATASDKISGLYRLQFYLNDELFAEDTEEPFNAYCAVRHTGEGIIKVIAEDLVHNTGEDTVEIIYYKIF